MLRLTAVVALAVPIAARAIPDAPSSTAPIAALPTTCGDLIRESNDSDFVYAKDVYDCFVTVPFNPAVATRLVKYYQDTLQFQANLDYLSHPGSEYQQPAVDLVAALDSIQATIDTHGFINEYQFEATLQNALYSANDPHLAANFGLLSSFSFGTDIGLVSLSPDGVSLPQSYLIDDIFDYQSELSPAWTPSPVTSINGTDAQDFITQFAALNSPGSVEPHADWNMVFESPVRDAFADAFSLLGGSATFYPGDDFDITFQNGTVSSNKWYAMYNGPGDTGPLETGGDFYNYFVLGLLPASYNSTVSDDTSDDPDDSGASQQSGDSSGNGDDDDSDQDNTLYYTSSGAFPEQVDVIQASVGDSVTRYVTGYLLNGTMNAALSLPTFYASNTSVDDFSGAVQEFLSKSKTAGFEKIIVDVQQNDGGDALLAYNTFRQFFPDREPFGGSNMRISPFINTTGSIINAWYSEQPISGDNYSEYANLDWVVTNRINSASGQYFSSWADFYGPYPGSTASSTATERYNISDPFFDAADLDVNDFASIPSPLIGQAGASPPYDASDILILSDAACTSACALFVEMMHYEAGVKTVVLGGRPESGPMQTVGGSRGAIYSSLTYLDEWVDYAQTLDEASAVDLPNRDDQSVYFSYGGLTLRNQVRQGQQTPVQMLYDAADCRLYQTFDTFYNLTSVWALAAAAIWSNQTLCVPGSTGFAITAGSPDAPAAAPTQSAPAPLVYSSSGTLQIPFLDGSELPPVPIGPAPDTSPLVNDITSVKGLPARPGIPASTRNTGTKSSDALVPDGPCGSAQRRKRAGPACPLKAVNLKEAAIEGTLRGQEDGQKSEPVYKFPAAVSMTYLAAYDAAHANAYAKAQGTPPGGFPTRRPRFGRSNGVGGQGRRGGKGRK